MARLRRQMLAALALHLGGGKPRPPVAGVALWQAFCALSDGRRYDGGHPLPIAGGEVLALERRQGARFNEDHMSVLIALDRAWLDHVKARAAGTDKAAVPMSAAAFDGMFG